MNILIRFKLVAFPGSHYRPKNTLPHIARPLISSAIMIAAVLTTLATTSAYAGGVVGILKGAYDYGQVNDGSAGTSKATDAGYTGEGILAYSWALSSTINLQLGGFYLVESSKTQTTSSPDTLQNFSISPHGYGLDVGFKISSYLMHAGYGYYSADARKVENSIGRNYLLTSGIGTHFGLGYIFHAMGKVNLFIDATYRQITYGNLQVKSGAGMALDSTTQWKQTLVSLGGGLLMMF